MRAIPAEVSKRWAPMWPKGHVPDRPWWSRYDLTYRRCDGIIILSRVFMDITHGDERGLWDGKEPYEDAMARIDAAHPLPAPPLLAGQVWSRVCPDGGVEDNLILYSHPKSVVIGSYAAALDRAPFHEPTDAAVVLLVTRSALVAGPTPWGRDCPWSPA